MLVREGSTIHQTRAAASEVCDCLRRTRDNVGDMYVCAVVNFAEPNLREMKTESV